MIQGGITGTLTGLVLGSGEPGVALTVEKGDITLGSDLKLVGKNTLALGSIGTEGQKLVLDTGFTFATDSTGSLTLQITEEMLKAIVSQLNCRMIVGCTRI